MKEKPVIIIAAMSSNGIIGSENNLPWRDRKEYKWDMEHFKNETINNYVIMGNNTFKSMHSKPLKDRINFIISKNGKEPFDYVGDNLYYSSNLKTLISRLREYTDDKKIFIIGGEALYKYAFDEDLVDTVILSVFNEEFEGDKEFPTNYFYNRFELIDTDIRQNGRILTYIRNKL